MKVFVINLERSTDRKAILEERAKIVGLDIEFIKAVDGRTLSDSEIESHTQPLNYAYMRGEVGCALSHQKIYRKIIEEDIPYALILEDDVILPDDISELLHNIKIDTHKPNVTLLSRVNKFITRPTKHINSKYALHKAHQATTAHAYISNKKAAKNMLDFLYPIWMVADKWAFFEDSSVAHICCIAPAPVILSEQANVSTINSKKGDPETDKRKKSIWNKIMKNRPLLTKLKHRYRRAIVPLFNKITVQGKGS